MNVMMKNHQNDRRIQRIQEQSAPYPLPTPPKSSVKIVTCNEGDFPLSETLITYNRSEVRKELKSLSLKYQPQEISEEVFDVAASKIIEELIGIAKIETNHSTKAKVNNGSFAKICKTFLKSLQSTNQERFQRIISTSISKEQTVNVIEFLTEYEEIMRRNQTIFQNITNHHSQILHEDWEKVVEDDHALLSYAEAAHQMGNKVWVAESNHYAFNYCKEYFLPAKATQPPSQLQEKDSSDATSRSLQNVQTGSNRLAIKYYMKELSSNPHSAVQSDDRVYWDTLHQYLSNIPLIDNPDQKIKLLDVGSCYNPLLKFPDLIPFFNVTAIDLCPADSSVSKCDFITVQIPDSLQRYQVLLETTTSTTKITEYQKEEAPENQELVLLPPAFYHAVVMSLVLSYLPTPTARETMIENARKVLISPDHEGKPHHGGLLIIIEKESIFPSNSMHKQTNSKSKSPSEAENKVTIDDWKSTISSKGFFFLRYELHMSSDKRKSHIFLFRATNHLLTDTVAKPLYIKQDFYNHNKIEKKEDEQQAKI